MKDPSDEQAEPKEVGIDIRMKAFMNAKEYYQEKKKLEVKEKKTMEASNQALKIAERAAIAEMNQVSIRIKNLYGLGKAKEPYACG